MSSALFPDLPEVTEAVDNPTAAHYATAAKYALKRKKRQLAVQQICAAIALEPQNSRHLQLLSEVVGTTPDPLALLRMRPEGTFYGVAAARAWTLARRFDSTEATRLLTEVVQFRPNVAFLTWLRDWEERFQWAKRVDPDAVADLVRRLLAALTSEGMEELGERNLDSALVAAELVQRLHPEHAVLRAARVFALRELGEFDDALGVASQGPQSWQVQLEIAYVRRALGQVDAELAALELTRELTTTQPSIHRELATTLVLSNRRAAAEETLRRANALVPTAWSRAALDYLHWLKRSVHPTWLEPETEAARELPFARDMSCLVTTLPDPVDPVVAIVRGALQLAARPGSPQRVDVQLRSAQLAPGPSADRGTFAPSAAQAWALGLATLGKQGALTVAGASVAATAPSLIDVSDAPAGALPPPDLAATALVLKLVNTRFVWTTWFDLARRLTREQPVDELKVLAVAVHPPPAPSGADAVQWLVHVHAAVGTLLGCLDAPDVPLNEATLRCLAANDDWVCNVGLLAVYARWAVALASAAPEQAVPAWLEQARSALRGLLPTSSESRCYARTLAVVGMALGGPYIDSFRDLRARMTFERCPTETNAAPNLNRPYLERPNGSSDI